MKTNELRERTWIDQFGEHFECSKIDQNGRLHSMKITKTKLGWSPSWDQVRNEVRRSAS